MEKTNANTPLNLVADMRIRQLEDFLKAEGVYCKTLSCIIDHLKTTDYFDGPSSTKWHAAYPGGGFDHAFNVTKCLVKFTRLKLCKWERNLSPYIVGLLHDYTKIGAYTMKQEMNPLTNEIETWYEWNKENPVKSDIHGEDSLLKVLQLGIRLTDQECDCIRWHMGAYETNSWSDYDAAIKRHPEVLFTHTADMYASKVMEVRLEK